MIRSPIKSIKALRYDGAFFIQGMALLMVLNGFFYLVFKIPDLPHVTHI